MRNKKAVKVIVWITVIGMLLSVAAIGATLFT
jgi:hypothetical protein